jgi:uncharacterized protein YqfA (UPF0365 family)
MLFAQNDIVLLFAVGIVFLVNVALFVVFVKAFAPWFQALMAGVPLSIIEILGMRFRKTDVKAVVKTLIMASQAGAPLSSSEVERAYLQGVDLEKITLAYIRAKKENMDLTFQDLVDADLDFRLKEKLGR